MNTAQKTIQPIRAFLVLSLIFLGLGVQAVAIPPSGELVNPYEKAPIVFQIGESPELFESLSSIYAQPLITACNEDMNEAFSHWLTLFKDLENFAIDREFNINGVKIWIKVFWNPDGLIDHMAFHLKPNSKNIDVQAFSLILEEFVSTYQLKVQSDAPFSHYGSASFPTMYRRIISE
ncbi:MAG: hypothetical protein AAFV80_19400 [Bacteroidota bacterium]